MINDSLRLKEILNSGRLVGEMRGIRETKYLGWKVFSLNEKLFAFVTDQDGSILEGCAEEILEKDLSMYVD